MECALGSRIRRRAPLRQNLFRAQTSILPWMPVRAKPAQASPGLRFSLTMMTSWGRCGVFVAGGGM